MPLSAEIPAPVRTQIDLADRMRSRTSCIPLWEHGFDFVACLDRALHGKRHLIAFLQPFEDLHAGDAGDAGSYRPPHELRSLEDKDAGLRALPPDDFLRHNERVLGRLRPDLGIDVRAGDKFR